MKVLVTGSNGFVGGVLRERLRATITRFDLPDGDARDYPQLLAAARGHDAIVHLAWDTRENFRSGTIEPANLRMAEHGYRAAAEAGVPRVVMASSVHADAFADTDPARPLDPVAPPTPDSPYGASKVFVEALGRHYATDRGLIVCCVRFGAVSPHALAGSQPEADQATWLGFDDCASLVQACLDADVTAGHFEIVNGVSRNQRLRHSLRNGIGWSPQQTPPSPLRRAVGRMAAMMRSRTGGT